ncbi:MAG: DUF2807 domain-containing protein [Betaproteobacteria bacterium]|nr:DUF2807 domain-containing protein [Betaproteobacteria bacterium]
MTLRPYLASLLLLTAAAANADTLRTQRIDLPAGIQQVVIETAGNLEIRPGRAGRLTIEAEPHVLQKLDNIPRQNTLTLRTKDTIITQHPIRYTLEIPNLRALTARGSGTIQIGPFRGDTLELELAGDGNATVQDITYKRLTLRLSGTGNIDISGRGDTLTATVSGIGIIRADTLIVTHAEATIVGIGDIYLQATRQIKGNIIGSGNIRYTGRPEIPPTIIGANYFEPQ